MRAETLTLPARRPDLNARQAEQLEAGLRSLREALENTRFGAVSLTVHEGRIVQLERTERLRFDRESAPAA